ncbi:hypothetical protein [Glutamicibacter halophytocola]|uniref:Ribosomally synthesized peptide with SipW-like signal peptide n=2 Tax=Glutamicibacter halophytocola TaxID=1933880 RepID=A0A5B8INS1_9MICC|nr:hypothetical protein [Glutamicibacter halophytocola]QDY66491.1 hypothetical protein FQA45_09205 [Glutamicibacter halophytocola]UUX58597.1 hypothetical protein NUH22_15050 [Glutamicibacter halophytocola]
MPKPLKFAICAAVLLLLGVSAQGTAANWRAESTVDPPALTSGSLALLAGGEAKYQFLELAGSELIPGSFTQAPLQISNAGTVDLSYQLNGAVNSAASPSSADQALAGALRLSVYAGMDPAACEADQPLAGEALYAGPLGSAASFASARVLGAEPVPESESLCVRVSVPSGAAQSAAGGRVELALKFAGQQR